MCHPFSILWLLLVNISDTRAVSRYLSSKSLRVHQGEDVKETEYPYVVVLAIILPVYYVTRVCTGVMITEVWGLTAGHCIVGFHPRLYAWYGNFTEPPTYSHLMSQVIEMTLHPSYRLLTTNGGRVDLLVNNDICVFRVSHRIDLQSYARLSSIDRSTMTGLPVIYIGGGSTTMSAEAQSYGPLQKGEGTIIPCDMEMSSKSKYVLCIAPKCARRMQRPWYGDSGGPLIYDGQVIGLGSYAVESPVIARAGYAPISPYIDWIYHIIRPIKPGPASPRSPQKGSAHKMMA